MSLKQQLEESGLLSTDTNMLSLYSVLSLLEDVISAEEVALIWTRRSIAMGHSRRYSANSVANAYRQDRITSLVESGHFYWFHRSVGDETELLPNKGRETKTIKESVAQLEREYADLCAKPPTKVLDKQMKRKYKALLIERQLLREEEHSQQLVGT